MYTKKNARVTFKSNRKSGFKRSNSNYSNGKSRNKGNVSQQYNKYSKLAKEAFTSGDRILSEYYYQYTDHYYRMMVELGINVEENDINLESKYKDFKENKIEKSEHSEEDITQANDLESNTKNDSPPEEENIESIESIPFIAEPAKKKRVTTTK
tara:strand:- start:154 stop:615 length:462 start_codon:yes stop_codon:yes gene_type:complete